MASSSSNPAAGVNSKSHCCKQEKWLLLMLESGDGLPEARGLVGWKATSKQAIRANKMQVLGARKKERPHREGEGARREAAEKCRQGLKCQSVFLRMPELSEKKKTLALDNLSARQQVVAAGLIVICFQSCYTA